MVGATRQLGVLLLTMGLSGLWHGAAWNFVAWGVFHALLLSAYRRLGLGASWRPEGAKRTFATVVMFAATLVGWMLFRAPSLGWLWGALAGFTSGFSADTLLVTVTILAFVALYSSPLLFMRWLDEREGTTGLWGAALAGAAIVVLSVFARDGARDFIYFQF